MEDQKTAIHCGEQGCLTVPKYEQTSLQRLWPIALLNPGFRNYLPDEWREPKHADRYFFFLVWTKVNPTELDDLIKAAKSQRNALLVEKPLAPLIRPTNRWLKLCLEAPWKSKLLNNLERFCFYTLLF